MDYNDSSTRSAPRDRVDSAATREYRPICGHRSPNRSGCDPPAISPRPPHRRWRRLLVGITTTGEQSVELANLFPTRRATGASGFCLGWCRFVIQRCEANAHAAHLALTSVGVLVCERIFESVESNTSCWRQCCVRGVPARVEHTNIRQRSRGSILRTASRACQIDGPRARCGVSPHELTPGIHDEG